MCEAAGLSVSELVTNAVLHTGGAATLTLRIEGEFLHAAVRDASPWLPIMRPPRQDMLADLDELLARQLLSGDTAEDFDDLRSPGWHIGAAGALDRRNLDALAAALDRIRAEVLADRGADDARYIRRIVDLQRRLEAGGRATLFASLFPPAWLAGTAMLTSAKILENMELGHNILHGQWDWMRDPQIHSTTWEWDHAMPAAQWKHAHNYIHHTYTNVIGKDRDYGYGLLRMSAEQRWTPAYLAQPVYNAALAIIFEWGLAIYDAEIDKSVRGEKPWANTASQLRQVARKAGRQAVKDYVAYPLLAGPAFVPVLTANLTANLARNIWTHTVIFCGHFPDGTHTFREDEVDDSSRGQWYLRQILGSANISGGPLTHLITGNLSHQIEHHLFPDLPSNRYAQIAPQVRAVCERFGLPYTTGGLARQALKAWEKVFRFALPPCRRAAKGAAHKPNERVTAPLTVRQEAVSGG